MRRSLVLISLFGIIFLPFNRVFAKSLNSVEFLSGWLSGDLREKDDYRVVPLMLSFGFDLKPLAEKIGIRTKGILEFQLEPFLNVVTSPDNNVEAGLGLLLKYAFPLNKRFMPYIKFGAGPVYISQHTREQSTQFNFVDTAGVGFSWFYRENLAFSFEYRYRHLSNASIKHPNKGIDANSFLMGISFFFD
ncbi:MAG: acyloxyacyl hydrolase [Candidatus Omnitrophica bacterium]|nr:acyloxyacyl hydrolase [Candidatus Omnitrophota bacterium]